MGDNGFICVRFHGRWHLCLDQTGQMKTMPYFTDSENEDSEVEDSTDEPESEGKGKMEMFVSYQFGFFASCHSFPRLFNCKNIPVVLTGNLCVHASDLFLLPCRPIIGSVLEWESCGFNSWIWLSFVGRLDLLRTLLH